MKYVVTRVFLSLLLLVMSAGVARAEEPFVWDGWITFYSLSVDQKAGSLKVAFGRRGKSATIFARILNDTALRVRGAVSFDLVDGETGKVETGKYAPFGDLQPGAVDQSMGNWFMVPDRTLTTNVYTVRNIRLKELWLPLPSDPNGPLYEYYPNNTLARKQQAMQDSEKKKADAEQQQQANERKRQEETAQRQRDDEQRRREAETERTRRENQRVVDDANRKAQEHVDQYNRQVQGMQETYQAGQDSKAEYERRKREIEERYANAGDDVDYGEVERALKFAEFYADLKRKAEADVRNYQNQAAYQTGAQKQVTLAAAAVMQIQVDKNAREEEKYRDKARDEERKAKEEARERRQERKQGELENLKKQAGGNNWQNNTGSSAQQSVLNNGNTSINTASTAFEKGLFKSIENKDVKAVTELLAAGTNVNIRNEYGITPLFQAVSLNDDKAVRLLLNAGADVNLKNDSGGGRFVYDFNAPLHVAVKIKEDKTIGLLLNAGADVNVRDKDEWTPLHWAANKKNDEAVESLINAGADVNLKNKDGETPLHLAASTSDVKMIELLLNAGASVNVRDKDGRTPLYNALTPWYKLKDNYEEIVDLLRNVGAVADINIKNEKGWTLLYLAVENNDEKAVGLLIKADADVNIQYQQGTTVLHRILERMSSPIYSVNPKIFDMLLMAGVDPNIPDMNGETPLHLAAQKLNDEIIEKLLEAGAKRNVKDRSGKTADYYLKQRKKKKK